MKMLQYLADIEDHLNITIQQVGPDMKVPCDEFDGKVVYGEKRKQTGTGYQVRSFFGFKSEQIHVYEAFLPQAA